MADVHGSFDDRFTAVRDAFAGNFDQGLDVGASACVIVDDEVVVDIWGGHVDAEQSAPWERDTITNVWSTTKTMTALSALLLADRGELDLHAPVARYWPEFAANGKEAVEVRHLMGHTAGLSGWQEHMEPEDLYDWDLTCSRLAAQAPWWEPGSASGYHALTQGYLVGEVVRRVSGQSLGTFFAKELAGPLDADFHIGLGPEHDHRVSRVIPPSEPLSAGERDPNSIAVRTLMNPRLNAEQAWEEPWRRGELPAVNGHGNARSVAAVQSLLSHSGERGGTRLMSEAGCGAVFERQASGVDLVMGAPLTLGTGYGISSPHTPIGQGERTCFWGGWGGSIVINDLDARMTVAYVMNRMGEGTLGDMRGAGIVFAAYAGLTGAA
jgi:CubicO group peptidase (beta-lactamase class C family)